MWMLFMETICRNIMCGGYVKNNSLPTMLLVEIRRLEYVWAYWLQTHLQDLRNKNQTC